MSERNYWMIGADGKSYGPADESTLQRWIRERRVAPTTQISNAVDGPWRDAQTYPEFAAPLGVDASSAATGAPAGIAAGIAAGTTTPPPPGPAVPPPEPTPYYPHAASNWPPGNLQAVLLIGGIFNILTGVCYLFSGCFCCLGIPCLVIGIWQCADYASASATPPQRYIDRQQTWGIINIVSAVLLNAGSVVCGILQLCWISEARQKYVR